MAPFITFLVLEFRRFTRKRNLFIFIITFLFALYFVNKGIIDNKNQSQKIENFKQMQKNYFNNTTNYEGYGRDGITMMYVPAPISVLFRNTVIPSDLTAKADSVVTLQINNNMKGKSLISRLFFGRVDFAVVVLIWLTLLALYYGFEFLYHTGYIKFLSSSASPGRVIVSLAAARYLVFASWFLLLFAGLLAFIKIRGIVFSGPDYRGCLLFLLVALGLMLVFFALGSIFGIYGSKKGYSFLMFVLWLLLMFAAPGGIVSAHEDKFPGVNKDFQTALKKFETAINFEEESEKRYGKFDRNNMELARKVIEKYWGKVYPEVESCELKLKDEIQAGILGVQRSSIWFPTTFFMMTCDEVSSCGYRNFIYFFEYSIRLMRNFVRFWIDRVFYHDHKKLVNFIKADENIFHARSRVPRFFIRGMVVTLAYGFILFLICFFLVTRLFYPFSQDPGAFDKFEMELHLGKAHAIRCYYPDFVQQFLNVFFGKKRGLNWQLLLAGKNIVNSKKLNFLYLPNPVDFPCDLKVKHILFLFKRFFGLGKEEVKKAVEMLGKTQLEKRLGELELSERCTVFLKLAGLTKSSVYILQDFLFRIPPVLRGDLSELGRQLKRPDALLIDLVTLDSFSIEPEVTSTINIESGKYMEVK
jgi:hypothetical protein